LFEWKELHNALDEIILSFAQFSAEIHRYEAMGRTAPLRSLRNLWYSVSVRVDTLLEFARHITIIGIRYQEESGKLIGEKWAVKLSELRYQINRQIGLTETLDISFSTASSVGLFVTILYFLGRKPNWWLNLCELNDEFNHIAYSQLHWADKNLRKTADELYTLSASVFGREG
jgi:hypothetical protein